MASKYLQPSSNGNFFRSRTLAVDYTRSVRQSPIDPSYHPPYIGTTVTHLLSGSFGCQFEPASEIDIPACTPLPVYIEGLLSATKLPFQVTVASLILLQRLYIRLPPEVFESRKHFSAHQLFTAAYITAARQYTQARLGLDFTHALTRVMDEPTLERDGITVAILMSNDYWSKRTSYPVQQIKEMQRQLQVALGGSIAIFPVTNPASQDFLKQIKSLPPQRRIPVLMHSVSEPQRKFVELKNLGRMSAAEHLEYFQGLSEQSRLAPTTTRKKA